MYEIFPEETVYGTLILWSERGWGQNVHFFSHGTNAMKHLLLQGPLGEGHLGINEDWNFL